VQNHEAPTQTVIAQRNLICTVMLCYDTKTMIRTDIWLAVLTVFSENKCKDATEPTPVLKVKFRSARGGMAQWLGRRSLAGGLP